MSFIIFLSCAYCLSSRFTSWTDVPLPRPPLAVDDRRRLPLPRRHRADDGLETLQVLRLGVELRPAQLGALQERHHVKDLVQRAHLPELTQLLREVLECEAVLPDLLGELLGLRGVHR